MRSIEPGISRFLNLSLLLRAIGKALGWRLRGKVWPHPFFEKARDEPVYPFTVLSREERGRSARYADRIRPPGWRVEGRYDCAFSFSAAFGAKYVKIPSAPARLKPSRLSIIARSPSIQPLLAAPAIIAYSPDT